MDGDSCKETHSQSCPCGLAEEVSHRKLIPLRTNAVPAEAPIWQQIPDVQVSDTSHIMCIILTPIKSCLILLCI